MNKGRIAIRFDGPPGAISGRFIEAERDGKGINCGEWIQDGEDWLLVLNPEVVCPDKRRVDQMSAWALDGIYATHGYLTHEDGTIPEADDPYFYIVDHGGEDDSWIGKGKTLGEAIDDAIQRQEKA